MRKRVIGLPPCESIEEYSRWLAVPRLAQVEVTSEESDHPLESVFTFGESSGWRAGSPGRQSIRLIFDQPQANGTNVAILPTDKDRHEDSQL
jgi:hypothetical protein